MTIFTHPGPDYAIEVRSPATGALVVRVDYDGTHEFGEGVTPTEAAEQLWSYIAGLAKCRCHSKEASDA